MNKCCTKCKKTHPKEDFHVFTKAKDGRQSQCKYCINAYKKVYREKNKEELEYRDRNCPKRRYTMYKSDATRRGYSFQLDITTFTKYITDDCTYCGASADPLNGVDRVDSSIGYEPDNCVSCCKTCNLSKGSLSYLDFIKMVTNVYKYSVERESTQEVI